MSPRYSAPLAGLVGLIVLGFSGRVGAAEDPDTGPADPPQVYPCHRARGSIAIDGLIDEDEWKDAAALGPFYQLNSGEAAVRGGSARLLWDAEALYLAADLADRDLYGVLEDHDAFTWHNDVIELFIKPRESSFEYYELHVTPRNTTLDLMMPRRGAGQLDRFISYESGMVTAVELRGTLNNWRDEDEGWSLEMKIPFSAFEVTAGAAPNPGDKWRFAVCRYNYSVHLPTDWPRGLENSTTVKNMKDGFHTYEQYDLLHFVMGE